MRNMGSARDGEDTHTAINSVQGERLGDAEFIRTFFPDFDTLPGGEQEAAITAFRAFIRKAEKMERLGDAFMCSFFPGFLILHWRKQRAARAVIKAFITKARQEGLESLKLPTLA